jgi:hypothetical protein
LNIAGRISFLKDVAATIRLRDLGVYPPPFSQAEACGYNIPTSFPPLSSL